jgi:serine protease inhibitor
VVVDRPFLFLVHDRVTGAVLQIGRVVDPRAGPTEPPAG